MYSITVNKPGQLPEIDPVYASTLEGAIERIEDAIDVSQRALGEDEGALAYFDPARQAALALTDAGTVIHMPDGYVIDVKPMKVRRVTPRQIVAGDRLVDDSSWVALSNAYQVGPPEFSEHAIHVDVQYLPDGGRGVRMWPLDTPAHFDVARED